MEVGQGDRSEEVQAPVSRRCWSPPISAGINYTLRYFEEGPSHSCSVLSAKKQGALLDIACEFKGKNKEESEPLFWTGQLEVAGTTVLFLNLSLRLGPP